ncbi:ABC transporter permease [Mesorhizobium sp.]|uniref:ABC transporter permease n=1 Tax=Mesorhizobium sp. TaxID=1871066 RepID=UPI00120940F8|nr:ABC transporter permease [Mesorhizobium sp.]TIS59634.1 MAG: ABC transporter permease [Mesorhizobium sp.]TIS88073.1 MAG: ABC transporter permease [Mesorhizobium sp.]
MKRLVSNQIVGPLAALLLVAVVVALTTNRFLDVGNLSNLILQVSIVAIVAIGSTIVIFTGGIDLSPGSAIALMTMVFAMTIKFGGVPLPFAVLLVLLIGVLLGAVNGVLTAYFRIPSFITTLAALSAFRGSAFMFNNGSPVFSVHPKLEPIFYGSLLGVPLPLFYVIGLYALAFFVMRYTAFGRTIYAVGGNPQAAALSGLNVARTRFLAFVIAGAMAAVGAVLMAARLNSGSPNYGVGMELSAIAAAVIGGASLAGGRGQIVSTVIGALTIVIVQNALNLNAVPASAQNVIIGAIIVTAVGVDMWRGEIGRALAFIVGALTSPGQKGKVDQ